MGRLGAPVSVDADPLAVLAGFLSALGTVHSPDEVAAAILAGPGRVLGAEAADLLVIEATDLRTVGTAGRTARAASTTLAIGADAPAAQAVREGEPVIGDTQACAPVILRGVTVGAVRCTCADGHAPHSGALPLLEAVARGVGLWLALPATTVLPRHDAPATGVALTDRQRAIVDLIATGATTAQIATTLGYSDSTIKQEVQRLMRMLEAATRHQLPERAAALGLLPLGPT